MELNKNIEKALAILAQHDWYYMMVDYGYSKAMAEAKGNMRFFVETINNIESITIREALRSLWCATYDYVHKTMFNTDKEAEVTFKTKKAALMAVIQPSMAMAA